MEIQKTLEKIEKILEEIRELSEKGVGVLVEGQRDIVSLRKLGIRENVKKIKGRGSILHVLEKISGMEEVVILTDFDRRGQKLAIFCAKQLRGLGIKPNLELREKLMGLVGKDIKDIEGLAKYLRGLEARCLPARSRKGTF